MRICDDIWRQQGQYWIDATIVNKIVQTKIEYIIYNIYLQHVH